MSNPFSFVGGILKGVIFGDEKEITGDNYDMGTAPLTTRYFKFCVIDGYSHDWKATVPPPGHGILFWRNREIYIQNLTSTQTGPMTLTLSFEVEGKRRGFAPDMGLTSSIAQLVIPPGASLMIKSSLLKRYYLPPTDRICSKWVWHVCQVAGHVTET